MILADLGLDDVTIAAALLHDAVEDTTVTLDDIEREFGAEVAAIVDGVTKLDRLQFDSKEAQQAATLRKMLVAMAKDIRVLLIKLADRLHNMRTIASLPEAKQRRIAQETLDIYAPLAHRLGIADVKWQLEDLAFAVLHPKRYAEIEQMVAHAGARARGVPRRACSPSCATRLAELHIDAEVHGPPEALLVDLREDGRAGQGVRRGPGPRRRARRRRLGEGLLRRARLDPRAVDSRCRAGSRTTSRCPSSTSTSRCTRRSSGRRASRSRCRSARRRCTAAPSSASPRTGATRSASPAEDLALAAAHGRLAAGDRRPGRVHGDAEDRPRAGRGLRLHARRARSSRWPPAPRRSTSRTRSTPRSGTAASARASTAGSCRSTPRSTSGDTVEIFTSKVEGAGPSRDWLQFVHTPKAKAKIRQWFSRERRVDAIDTGRDELAKALRREGLPVQKLGDVATLLDGRRGACTTPTSTRCTPRSARATCRRKAVAQRLQRELRGGEEQLPVTAAPPAAAARAPERRAAGVHVEGLDDVMVRLSRCCTPVPGDEIMGFVTRGRGVSVHRTDCANADGARRASAERLIEVEWDHDQPATFVVSVEVEALDRSRLLRDVARCSPSTT